MKKLLKTIVIILILLCIAICVCVFGKVKLPKKLTNQKIIHINFSKSKKDKKDKKDKKKGKKEYKADISKTLDQFEGPYDATKDLAFLQSVQKVAEEMVDHGFVYNTSGIGDSLQEAKEGNCHGDCAHLICWALQDMGILNEKQTFYSKKHGVLSCDREGKIYNRLIEYGSVIEIDPIQGSDQEALKKVLKVGDICCYSLHMNVVAGIDKKGNILYYDAGLTPVKNHKKGKEYLDNLKKPYARPKMKNTLYTIIRLDEM